ncbi:unnamed protein product [Clonostachys rhizophaga]|uniref:Endosomal spry domain-containing protein n=1 Tax=Clonostachys rhizophaga TaxID=160324 RepID=A0A9N9YGR5_9HYPO|nr:unnamed protein product [Clonostachys rhizophaga]
MAPTPTQNLGSVGDPFTETHRLFARDAKDPSKGVLDPHDINNAGFFVLFALIGVGFVITGIWFFFWAKNGGFHFKENDWDDYKTTVLRRRGPNGTVLSGATESTDLGGGSVYKDVADHYDGRTTEYDGRTVITDDTRTVITESTGMTGITAGASDIAAREKRKKKKEQRDQERERRRKERGEKSSSRRHVGDEGVEDAEAEAKAKAELRNYRHEKPARVGGLNKVPEGSEWDGSTNPADSTVSSSLMSGRESTPTSTPTKEKRGIRKVYSTADRNDRNEQQRARAEARRERDENRVARRDFSFQRSVVGTESQAAESLLESNSNSDLGTKSYHHPMPELRQQQREREREERRARRGGYRRGRGEDEDL